MTDKLDQLLDVVETVTKSVSEVTSISKAENSDMEEDKKLIEEMIEESKKEDEDEGEGGVAEKSDDEEPAVEESKENEDPKEDEEVAKSDYDTKLDSLIEAVSTLASAVAEIKDSLAARDEVSKSLHDKIEVLSKTRQSGAVRSVVLASKSEDVKKDFGLDNVISKCINLQKSGKMTATDTVIIEMAMKSGAGIPDKYIDLLN